MFLTKVSVAVKNLIIIQCSWVYKERKLRQKPINIHHGNCLYFTIAVLALSTLFLYSCGSRPKNDNFILITLDTQREDYISAYSLENASTPNIDFLAEKGILYENCFSLIPITLPSHASIFFSQPPNMVKNYNNAQIINTKRKRPSFVSVFRGHEYTTAAFVSLGVLKSKFGLGEAFDFYEEEFPQGLWYLSAEEVNKKVFPWLEQNKNKKFFLWIHYSDPHDPYAPPHSAPDLRLYLNDELIKELCLNKYKKHELILNLKKGKSRLRLEVENEFKRRPGRFQARFNIFDFSPAPDQKDLKIHLTRGWLIQRERSSFLCKKNAWVEIESKYPPPPIKLTFRGKLIPTLNGTRELYKREVEYMDNEIGKLWDKLRELRLFNKTHILMVGDHGEGLGEYQSHMGGWHIGHIHFLYNIYMKVPLIIYNPQASLNGIRKKAPVTLLDIAPTIMEIMNFEKLSSFQGRNILFLKDDEELVILEETYTPEAGRDKFALLKFPWHLIITPEKRQYELFNLRDDPEEKKNIYQKDKLPQEAAALKQKLDSLALEILKGKVEVKIDEKSKEILRALGYIK